MVHCVELLCFDNVGTSTHKSCWLTKNNLKIPTDDVSRMLVPVPHGLSLSTK